MLTTAAFNSLHFVSRERALKLAVAASHPLTFLSTLFTLMFLLVDRDFLLLMKPFKTHFNIYFVLKNFFTMLKF